MMTLVLGPNDVGPIETMTGSRHQARLEACRIEWQQYTWTDPKTPKTPN